MYHYKSLMHHDDEKHLHHVAATGPIVSEAHLQLNKVVICP